MHVIFDDALGAIRSMTSSCYILLGKPNADRVLAPLVHGMPLIIIFKLNLYNYMVDFPCPTCSD